MPEPDFDTQRAQRWFAVECNNRAWDLLESGISSDDERVEAVRVAEAASYHWHSVGTDINRMRAEVLLATVYSAVGSTEIAELHGRLGAELLASVDADATPFDRATCHAAAGRWDQARAACGELSPEDRAVVERFYPDCATG